MGVQFDKVHPSLLAEAGFIDALEVDGEDAGAPLAAAHLLRVGQSPFPVPEDEEGLDILHFAAAFEL